MNIINAALLCPKHHFCNSSFCPADMSGLHRRDEAICIYFRMLARGEPQRIPAFILEIITENQDVFLDKDFRGYTSEYRKLLRKG
jgi:hypothetical protein